MVNLVGELDVVDLVGEAALVVGFFFYGRWLEGGEGRG